MKSCLVVDDSKVVGMVAQDPGRPQFQDRGSREREDRDGPVRQADAGTPSLLDWNMPVARRDRVSPESAEMAGGQTPIVVFCTTETTFSILVVSVINAGANRVHHEAV